MLGEIVVDGSKRYAVIGAAANKLFAVVLVADVDIDGPATMYCMPLGKLKYDATEKVWKTDKKESSIIRLFGG